MYEDMPPAGTRQWGQWFQQQDPQTQQQVIFDFGLADANTPTMGASGTMQPEIGAQTYGMLDQMSSPPVINSKGIVQPQGAEQMQKELNLFQDQNSLMTDNMMAAIAGQFAPTAFESTYKPQGNPVQATGLRQLQSLANTGGWEGFMASQMLPKDFGGGGMSSSQAKGALLKALKTPDTADEQALAQREELRGSLTPRYETQGKSNNPGIEPVNKDLSTDQGIVNSFDFTDVDTVSRGWQSDLAKDPVIGYTDPKTGLSYTGALAEKTPTMEWFDKYGLPYATKRYDDPDEIRRMQDAVAPAAPGQMEAEDMQRDQALSANAKARSELGAATSQDELLRNAYNKVINTPTGINIPNPRPKAPSNPAGLTPLNLQPGGLIAGSRPDGGAGLPPQVPAQPATDPGTHPYVQDKFLMDIDPTGKLLGLSKNQSIPWGGQEKPTKMGAGMQGSVMFDWANGATIPAAKSPLEALGLKPLAPGSNRRAMTAKDLAPAAQRVAMAKRAAAATVPAIQAASNSSDTSMQRQLARAKLMGLASVGRTPLSDTLAGRMMAARAAGVYG